MDLEKILKRTAAGIAIVAVLGLSTPKEEKAKLPSQATPSAMDQARSHMSFLFMTKIYDGLWSQLGYTRKTLSTIPDSIRYGADLNIYLESQNIVYELNHQGRLATYKVSREQVLHELKLSEPKGPN